MTNTNALRLILIVALLSCSAAAAENALIVLYSQYIGPAIKTHEIRLESNGDIVEETYDWTMPGGADPHTAKTVRTLAPGDIPATLTAAKEFTDGLPEYVDPDLPSIIDGPFLRVLVKNGSTRLKSTWFSCADSTVSQQGRQFSKAWLQLRSLLLGERPNQSFKVTCVPHAP